MTRARRQSTASESQKLAFQSRRGRPSAGQAAAIAASILDAATEIFLREGFQGASMDAIAARANVPKSTIYKRFSDKTELLREVIRNRVQNWTSLAARNDWKLTDDLEQRLRHHASAVLTVSLMPEVRMFRRLAAAAWDDTAAGIAERNEVTGFRQAVDRIEQDIRKYGPASGIAAENPRTVALAVMQLVEGWLGMQGADLEITPETVEDIAATMVALLMRGQATW